mmetsp:Transcript_39499/g.108831  ORF Transcript_39499/g.108831 Transcript_39499/m.108831 type:complete len:215 (-) Transcript_39499:983-1627(-)
MQQWAAQIHLPIPRLLPSPLRQILAWTATLAQVLIVNSALVDAFHMPARPSALRQRRLRGSRSRAHKPGVILDPSSVAVGVTRPIASHVEACAARLTPCSPRELGLRNGPITPPGKAKTAGRRRAKIRDVPKTQQHQHARRLNSRGTRHPSSVPHIWKHFVALHAGLPSITEHVDESKAAERKGGTRQHGGIEALVDHHEAVRAIEQVLVVVSV